MVKKRKKAAALPRDGVVLDLETTGLSPKEGARVIEIGAVRIRNGELREEFDSLVNPGIDLPEIVTEITGIKNEDLVGAPTAELVIPKLLEFIGKDPIIAHNAGVEREFLASECQCIGLLPPNFDFHCTLRISRRRIDNAPNCKLETLARSLNLPADDGFHRALKDARITAHLWLYLWQLVRRQKMASAYAE